MADIDGIRKTIKEIEKRTQQLEAKKEVVDEQLADAKKEAAKLGFKGSKQLRQAAEQKEAEENRIMSELKDIVVPFMPGGEKRHLLEDA